MLKQASDGLSKVWKVHKTNDPFYSGGKVEVSVDESKIICMYEENVSIIDVAKDDEVKKLFVEDESSEPIACFAYHPNKEEIVVATQKSSLIHMSTSGEIYRTVKAHQMPILCMQYDPTGTLVVTGSADRTVRVWDIAGGFCTHSFKEHTDIVRTVTFHPDPQRLQVISTSEDNTIRIYDLRESKCVAVFRSHVSLPTAVTFSPDGYIMASCGRDKVVNFYELRHYEHIKTIPVMEELEGIAILNTIHSQELIQSSSTSSSASKNSLVLVTAGEQGVLKFFSFSMKGKDVNTFDIVPLLHFHLSSAQRQVSSSTGGASSSGVSEGESSLQGVASLHYLSNTGELLSVTKDYNLCSYAMSSFQAQLEQQGSISTSDHVRIEPSKLLIGSQGEILDMSLIPGSPATTPSVEGETSNSPTFQLALITNSTQVRIVNDKFHCTVLEGHRDIVLCVDAMPDGEHIVTSSKDRRCLVWNIRTHTCVAVGEGHTDAIGAVCASQNKATYASRAAFIATGAADKILKRWALPLHNFTATSNNNTSSGIMKLVSTHSVRAHDKDINAVAVSPNDAMIASASQDKSVRLWRSSDLTPVATLNGHKRGVWKVSFSPVDKVLVSCSGDRTVKMWSVVDHALLRTFEGHTASVLAVKFVNKGTQLVSASADGLVRVWTVRTGECETTLDIHTDRVWSLECLETSTSSSTIAEGEKKEDIITTDTTTTSSKNELYFFSGGSDSKLIQWKDVTVQEEMTRMQQMESNLLLEQQMQNDLRNKRYDKALATALDLGHSLKVLNILTAILEENKKKKNSTTSSSNTSEEEDLFTSDWSKRLDTYVLAFTEEQLEKIINYLKDWNSNARHCYVSQVLINSLLRIYHTDRLCKHRVVLEALPALISYSERHYQRLDRLNQASYMLDYFASMISLLPTDSTNTDPRVRYNTTSTTKSSKKDTLEETDTDIPVLFKSNTNNLEDTDNEESDEEADIQQIDTVIVADTTVSSGKKRKLSKTTSSSKKMK